MIPQADITAWGVTRPWPNPDAIEQDLLLARTIVAIYQHPVLSGELVFRGGTALHQVHLPSPWRYSEDLDFVRRTNSKIGPILDALRDDVAAECGLQVRSVDLKRVPKVKLRGPATSDPGRFLNLKIEMNTHETSPALDLITMPFRVSSNWFTGSAQVLTFQPAELVSTKLRALYQRKKGRDLFDLWLALNDMKLPPQEILAAFLPYRPQGAYTSTLAIANLESKLSEVEFRDDLRPLVAAWPPGYDIDSAGAQVISELLAHV